MPELSSHGTVSNMRCVFQPNAGAPGRPKRCAEGYKPKPVTPPWLKSAGSNCGVCPRFLPKQIRRADRSAMGDRESQVRDAGFDVAGGTSFFKNRWSSWRPVITRTRVL